MILPLGWAGSIFFSSEWVPYLPEHVCQIWLRSDGRVEKKGGGYRQTDRQTDRQRFLQLYIVDNQMRYLLLQLELWNIKEGALLISFY